MMSTNGPPLCRVRPSRLITDLMTTWYKRLSEKMIRVGPTACWGPCDTGQRPRSPGFSRFRPHTG
jgi:hypothetical protein